MTKMETKIIINNSEEFIPKVCLSTPCKAIKEYFRETSLRIDLERQNREIREENALYQEAISSLLNVIKNILTPNFPANNLLREKLKNIPNVINAYTFVNNDVINYWIIIEEENFEDELEIADAFRETLSVFNNLLFDFIIIPRQGVSLEKIVPKNSQLIYSTI